jgi:hypothetical protein
MLRPEQLRLGSPDDPAAVQAAVGQVVYYGQTASVALALSRTGDRVMASVSGHVVPVFGDVVGVTVEGCVMAYPVARC